MNTDEIFRLITESNANNDWLINYRNGNTSATFKGDAQIHIESNDDDIHAEDYKEAWANRHADPKASSSYFNIYFGTALLKRTILVSVDGARAQLPMPDSQTNTPSLLDFRVAEIINYDNVHQYMSKAGLHYPEGA